MSTPTLAQLASGQPAKEVKANENFRAVSAAALFAQRSSVLLTWDYYGGNYIKADGTLLEVADGTIALTASATNYLYADDGVVTKVTVAPSGWPSPLGGNKVALFEIVTDASAVTDGGVSDFRTIGLGAGGSTSATDVSIADAGGYYTGTDVEAALQEIGADLAVLVGTTDVDTDVAYTSDTGSTADSDPGNGLFKWNNGTQASSTALYFDNQSAPGVSLTTFFAALPPDGFIHLVQDDDATKWQLWKWSGLPTAGSGYYKFTGLTLMASGGSLADNKATSVSFKGTPPATQPFDVAAFFPGAPTASAKVLRIPIARAVSFAANFSGSYAKAATAATGSTAFDVQKNGSTIGTITFAASGTTATLTSSGGSAQSFAAGDILSIIAPSSADATLADIGFTLAGTR